MAFDVEGAKKAGYSDQEIADHLAQASNFDASAAMKAGYTPADIISHLSSAPSKVDTDARKYVDSTPKAVRAFTQGVTLGGGDELDAAGAFAQTALGNTFKRLTGKPVDYSAADAYKAVQRVESQDDKQFSADRPLTAGALNFGGALATPGMGTVGKFVAKGAPALVAGAKEIPVVGNALSGFLGAGKGAAVARAAVTGAATGGTAGAALADPGSRGSGAALGAVTGAGLGAGIQKVGNALAAPFVETAQRRLSREGVDLTPGQMVGGLGKRVEDVLTSLPITGGAINAARGRGVQDLNIAAANRSLAPIGTKLDDGVAAGHEALQAATKKISDHYNAALDPVQVSPDEDFVSAAHDVISRPNLSASVKSDLTDIVHDIADRFKPGTTGRDWKAIDADLGAQIRSADNGSATDPTKIKLKEGLQNIQTAMRGVLERQAPEAATKVKQADEATANLVRLRQAAQSIGSDADGVVTPAQLRSATRATDTSSGNRQFATGNALMQDLANDAVKVLPNKVPDSGTAIRGMMGLGAYGGLSGAAGPHAAATALAADAIGSTLYSKPVMKLVNNIYRATDRKSSDAALSELEAMAAKDPKVAKLYQKVTAQLARRAPSAVIEQTQRSLTPGISVEVPGLGVSYP